MWSSSKIILILIDLLNKFNPDTRNKCPSSSSQYHTWLWLSCFCNFTWWRSGLRYDFWRNSFVQQCFEVTILKVRYRCDTYKKAEKVGGLFLLFSLPSPWLVLGVLDKCNVFEEAVFSSSEIQWKTWWVNSFKNWKLFSECYRKNVISVKALHILRVAELY